MNNMDEKIKFSVKPKKFTPIVDKDLQLLNAYFMTQYSYAWDELAHMDAETVNKNLLKIKPYIDAIERLNKKLLLT